MICDARNVYPNNVVIDPDISSERQIRFDFYGTYSIGADFRVYNANTMEQLTYEDGTPVYWLDRKTGGYYNGDMMDCKFGEGFIKQNCNYVWQARIYHDIDFDMGNYPSVILSNGLIQEDSWLTTKIALTVNATNNKNSQIKVDTDLTVTIPSYAYIGENNTWYLVKEYNSSTGYLTLNKPIIEEGSSKTIVSGTSVVISKYKTNEKPDLTKSYISIEPNNDCISTNSHDYTYWKTIDDLDSGDESKKAYNTYIKINNQYYAITDYMKNSGIVYFAVDPETTFEVGTPYEIYCNYVKTPYYYFSTKPLPEISATLTYENECLKCYAEITNQYYDIKYYFWEIYENNVLIETSENIYSAELGYYGRIFQSGKTYDAKITIVTQDNRQYSKYVAETLTLSPLSGAGVESLVLSFDKERNAVKISASVAVTSGSKTNVAIVRKEVGTSNYEFLDVRRYTEASSTTYYGFSYTDTTCAINKEYTYYIIPRNTFGVHEGASETISTALGDWSISFVRQASTKLPSLSITEDRDYFQYMYGDATFKHIKTFSIGTNVSVDNITHNIGNETKKTYSATPSGNWGDNDYDSFSLTFMLADVQCDNISFDQSDFEEWKKLVAQNYSVIIKDIKGNVWVGEITSHSYSVDYYTMELPYTITIDFEQVYSNNNVKVIE